MKNKIHTICFGIMIVFFLFSGILISKELTKASQSKYNNNIRLATTSENLSKADLAWHAQNTYGWDCSEVVQVNNKYIKTNGKELKNDSIKNELKGYYYVITCSSKKQYRAYPRKNYYPVISNINGGFSGY